MSVRVQHRRGTTTDHASFAGAAGEFTFNTATGRIHAHDGSTAGGIPARRLDDPDLRLTTIKTATANILASDFGTTVVGNSATAISL